MHGLAETRLGQVVSALPRNQIVIATKVGFDISGAESMRDYTRDGVRRSLDSSLKRLGVEQIDLLYVHDPDDYTQQVLDETFRAGRFARARRDQSHWRGHKSMAGADGIRPPRRFRLFRRSRDAGHCSNRALYPCSTFASSAGSPSSPPASITAAFWQPAPIIRMRATTTRRRSRRTRPRACP